MEVSAIPLKEGDILGEMEGQIVKPAFRQTSIVMTAEALGDDSLLWRVRKADSADADLLWRWANDADVRGNSFSPEPVLYPEHAPWVEGKLSSINSATYIVELDNQAVGQVRYDKVGDTEAEIDISIAPNNRALGYGVMALKLTQPLALIDIGVSFVTGVVIASNKASCAMFLRAGFKESWPRTIGGHDSRVYHSSSGDS